MNEAQKVLDGLVSTPSFDKFKKTLKKKNIKIADKDIRNLLRTRSRRKEIITRGQIRKPLRIVAFSPLEKVNMDIIDIKPNLKRLNKALVFVDIFSRYMWVYPMKDKKATSVLANLKKFLDENKNVGTIISDNDSSFKDRRVQQEMKDRKVFSQLINVSREDERGHRKLGVMDRAVKSLKELIADVYLDKKQRYIDVLPQIVKEYNERPHSSLDDKSPSEVIQGDDQIKGENMIQLMKNILKQPVIKVGDSVRVEVERGSTFRRRVGDTIYSEQIYKVIEKKPRGKIVIQDNKNNTKEVSIFSVKKVREDKDSSTPTQPRQQDVRRRGFISDRERRRLQSNIIDDTPQSRTRAVRGQDVGVDLGRQQRTIRKPTRFRD